MKQKTIKKLQPWTKKDLALNILVYFLNFVVLAGMFVGMVYLTSSGETKLIELLIQRDAVFLLVLLAMVIFLMIIYLAFEQRDFLKNAANSEMLFLIMEVALAACFFTGEYVSEYFRPLSLVALLVLFVTNTKTATFTEILFCLIFFLFDTFNKAVALEEVFNYSTLFLIMGICSGFLAVYVMKNVYSRVKLFALSILISLPCVTCIFMPFVEIPQNEIFLSICYGILSGPLAAVIFTIILPIIETLFNKVSCFKYAELTNHNAKFIRKMIVDASGTFNHSMVVSNIAEACASAINEDPLLARTCAYYHDVGKIRRPEMFKENQADGVNPHEELTPELSVNIIRSHTADGYKLIAKNRLPKEIADVCLEHHGTMPILYFYDKAKKFTDGEVDIAEYCYAGPKPRSKIAAIIMIADSSEAATRALKDRSRDNVIKVVRKIVNDRLDLGQFDECEITLKELNIIINATANSLTGVYHDRVEYPKVNLEELKTDYADED